MQNTGYVSTELAIFKKHRDQLRQPPPIPSELGDSKGVARPQDAFGKLTRYSEPLGNLLEYRPNRDFNRSIQQKREQYDTMDSQLKANVRDYSGYRLNKAFEYRTMGIKQAIEQHLGLPPKMPS